MRSNKQNNTHIMNIEYFFVWFSNQSHKTIKNIKLSGKNNATKGAANAAAPGFSINPYPTGFGRIILNCSLDSSPKIKYLKKNCGITSDRSPFVKLPKENLTVHRTNLLSLDYISKRKINFSLDCT